MEILGGLAIFGTLLNSNSNDVNKKSNKVKTNKKNYNSIYDSDNIGESENYIKNLSKNKQNESRRKKTNTIGMINKKNVNLDREEIQSDSEFSDSDIESFDNVNNNNEDDKSVDINDLSFFVKSQDKFKNCKYEKKITNKNKKNTFLSQFETLKHDVDGDPVSLNNIPNLAGDSSTVNRLQIENQIMNDGNFSNFNEDQDMTYNIVSKKDFKHNNMVPFGSTKNVGNTIDPLKTGNIRQRVMELNTGSSKDISFRHKKEQKPLFSPLNGIKNVNGTPVYTNEFEGRYIPSKERRNETLFDSTKVTPGLGLGANQNSKSGFHDTYRVLPKTTNE